MGFVTINEGINKSIGTNSKDLLYIQRFIRDTYKPTLENMLDSTNLNGAESFVMNCSEYDMVFFKVLFSVSNASAKFRIKLYDLNDVYIYSEQYTISSTGILEDSLYVGELLVADVRGFNKVAIRLDSDITNGGNVKILGGGMGNDVIVDKGYIIYGKDSSVGLRDTDEYNNQTDSWASKTDGLSPERWSVGSVKILNKGYGNYGRDSSVGLRDTDEYNNQTDSWASKTDGLSPARIIFPANTILNKGYMYGGSPIDYSTYYKDVDEYNPDTWVSKMDMLSPAKNGIFSTTIMLQNKGYIAYGTASGIGGVKTNYEYNPDTWVIKSEAISPIRSLCATNSVINKGYITGGWDDNQNLLQDTDEYNNQTDSWVSKTNSLSPPRRDAGLFPLLNKIYFVVGGDGTNYYKDIDEYNPDTWVSKMDIISPARWVIGTI